MEKLLTIAFPVYKRTDYFRTALESAINQSVPCSILVVDNNSPHDEFLDIVNSYNNPRIEYIKTTETVPQDENFNNCIRFTKTPWITILHDDDYLHFQFVELARNILSKHGNLIGAFSVKNYVGSEEWKGVREKVRLSEVYTVVKPAFFYFRQLTPFPGVVFNRELGLKQGGFNVPLHPIADLDFWRKLTESSTMLFVDQELAYYRISPNQSTNRLIDDMINNVYRYRLKLVRERRNGNNLLTRLAIEFVRIVGIEFFVKQYPHIDITTEYPNKGWMKTTSILMKIPFFRSLMWKYIAKMSYGRNVNA